MQSGPIKQPTEINEFVTGYHKFIFLIVTFDLVTFFLAKIDFFFTVNLLPAMWNCMSVFQCAHVDTECETRTRTSYFFFYLLFYKVGFDGNTVENCSIPLLATLPFGKTSDAGQ